MKQLYMRRRGGHTEEHTLPEGYTLQFFDGTKEAVNDWLEICHGGLNPDKSFSHFQNAIINKPDINPMKDIFFVVSPDGIRVATTTCIRRPEGIGGVHMVAALERYRGKGIGHFLITKAVNILADRGFTVMGLTTDDFRLPAIKTYLDAGFRPYLVHDDDSDMVKRWDDVLEKLGYPKVEYYPEEE